MLQWLLHMGGARLYLFLIKASPRLQSGPGAAHPSKIGKRPWQWLLCAQMTCVKSFRTLLQLWSFRHRDDLLPYVSSVLEHVKAGDPLVHPVG